jgi:hypothetical protein
MCDPVWDEVIEGLAELARDLTAGVQVEATEVSRADTPDGPMHVSRPTVIGG